MPLKSATRPVGRRLDSFPDEYFRLAEDFQAAGGRLSISCADPKEALGLRRILYTFLYRLRLEAMEHGPQLCGQLAMLGRLGSGKPLPALSKEERADLDQEFQRLVQFAANARLTVEGSCLIVGSKSENKWAQVLQKGLRHLPPTPPAEPEPPHD